MKTRLALSLAIQGYSPTKTHYTNKMKQKRGRGKMNQEID